MHAPEESRTLMKTLLPFGYTAAARQQTIRNKLNDCSKRSLLFYVS